MIKLLYNYFYMRILVVYATYSNSTFLAASILETELMNAGHQVSLNLVSEVDIEQFKNVDLIIFTSPSWDNNGEQGLPHQDYEGFKERLGNITFPNHKFAIMGLGDSTYTYFCGAVSHLEKMVEKMQGTLVLPSLKLDQFYIYEQECTQEIKKWAAAVNSKLT